MQNVFHNGKMIAPWPAHLSKTSGDTKKLFEIIDPEVAFSIGWTLSSFDGEVKTALADKLLSPLGQKQAQQNAANRAVKRLALRAKDLLRAVDDLRERHTNAVEVPTPSANDTMIDIALAQMLREQGAKTPLSAMKLRNSSERMRHALLRMPVELTGISQDLQDQIRLTFIAPSVELNFTQVKEAIGITQYALNKAAAEVVTHLPNRGADVTGELDTLAKAGVRTFLPSPMGSNDPAVRKAEISRRLAAAGVTSDADPSGLDAELAAWRDAQGEFVTVADVEAKRAELESKYGVAGNPAAQPA
jgi:hypothetical protein